MQIYTALVYRGPWVVASLLEELAAEMKLRGVVYGIFDATRIQDSLALYHGPADSCFHLAINLSGLAAFEDYLRARHSVYLQLYFHKTSVAAEAMMQNLSQRLGELLHAAMHRELKARARGNRPTRQRCARVR